MTGVQTCALPIYDSLRWAAENDIPFAQIDAMLDECKRDAAFYRAVQKAAGHAPAPRLIVTREIFVAKTDAEAREKAYPWLVRYWNLWDRYAQFTAQGRMPEDYAVWRERAPRLAKMSFDEVVEAGLILVGAPDTVARHLRTLTAEVDLFALACVFKFGGMPFELLRANLEIFAREVRPLLDQ